MDSLFLGINIIVSGLITALFLSIIITYLFKRSENFKSLSGWLARIIDSKYLQRNSQSLLSFILMISLWLILTVLMSLEPDQGGVITSFIKNLIPESSWRGYSYLVDEIVIALGVIFILVLVPLINWFFLKISAIIHNLRNTRFKVVRIQNLEIFTPNRMVKILILITRYIRHAVFLIIGVLFVTMVFSLYPQTEGIARLLLEKMGILVSKFWTVLLNFIPNLLALFVIALITRLALKLLYFFYQGLQQGKIKFSSIHPEVVEPTYQLLRFLVIAFALVAAFPHIPGSSSPMFRGLSIFVGFLISLGSTSLVTNIISGIVLTYSRGLKIGDRVKIGDTEGDVIDRTLLVTRVKTIKNVIVTIPNVIVMQNEIVNYSSQARESGLVLHTSVTIGYAEPWRLVQDLLISAALETADILDNPSPFVLKISLNDHHITYELNAYTAKPLLMADIYSELHQNILDKFNLAEVEILSPAYFAYRDGKDSTIHKLNSSRNGNGSEYRKLKPTKSLRSNRERTQPLSSG